MQEIGFIKDIKDVIFSIGTGIVSGGIGGGVAELYVGCKKGKFRAGFLIVSIIMGAFAGYITQEFTSNGAMAGLAGALSMKIFDFINSNSETILKQYIEKKAGIIIENKDK